MERGNDATPRIEAVTVWLREVVALGIG